MFANNLQKNDEKSLYSNVDKEFSNYASFNFPHAKGTRMRTLVSALMMFAAVGWAQPSSVTRSTVLIAYYSSQGHTRAMAEAVARGASAVPGAAVRLKAVADVAEKNLLDADAIIVGSPVYNANVSCSRRRRIRSGEHGKTIVRSDALLFVYCA